jgi:hypothetical protein
MPGTLSHVPVKGPILIRRVDPFANSRVDLDLDLTTDNHFRVLRLSEVSAVRGMTAYAGRRVHSTAIVGWS